MANRIRLIRAGMRELLNSPEVVELLMGLAEPVAAAARRDPNPAYAESVRVTEHHSEGRGSRASARVGAAPWLGMRVEAKRGTLARAMGDA